MIMKKEDQIPFKEYGPFGPLPLTAAWAQTLFKWNMVILSHNH